MRILLVSTLALILFQGPVHADVEPGDVIDQSNYQKIEGLVPDYIIEWVKNGDMTMKIGKLNYDPADFWPKEVKDNWQANIGRYRIDENNGIIDVKTGKPARGIKGIPFPELDPKDPTVPQQILWNNSFQEYYVQGSMHEKQYWLSVSRRGLEKTVVLENLSISLDPAKSEYDYSQLTVFRQPFNMAGTGTLVIYSLYPPNDGVRYAYTPELRRVKRLSHRVSGSEARFGLDNSPDDSWAGGPKINFDDGIYRLVGEKVALVPVESENPRTLEWTEKGTLTMGHKGTGRRLHLGFEDKGWKGAPWHAKDLVWVKTPVWVIESKSKDRNYAYGPCEGWIQKGSLSKCYKRITDPGGKLWKGIYWPQQAVETPDGKFRLGWTFGWFVVDMRRDHGSSLVGAYWKGGYRNIFLKDANDSLFTRAGFIKYSK